MQWRENANGERQWLSADGYWYPSEAEALIAGTRHTEPARQAPPPPHMPYPPAAPPAGPPPIARRSVQKKRSPWLRPRPIIILTVLAALIIWLVVQGSSSSSGGIAGKVTNVQALAPNTVRIYLFWTNSGSKPATANCVLNTTVHNQFGDQVNLRVNATGSNGNIAAGGTSTDYQDVGVDNGDAPFVTKGDIKILDC